MVNQKKSGSGGKRSGAGRPQKYSETEVKTIRFPKQDVKDVSILTNNFSEYAITAVQEKLGKEPTQIANTGAIDDFEIFTLPDGKKICIGKYDLDFFKQLQRLPAQTKIRMMQLTAAEMEESILESKNALASEAIRLLKSKWMWRETGDDFTLDQYVMEDHFGLTIAPKDLLPRIKKGKVSDESLEKIIKYFTSDYREVNLKD